MEYYDLTKKQRTEFSNKIEKQIEIDIINNEIENIRNYSSDTDTYIRKRVYIILGKLYCKNIKQRKSILKTLKILLSNKDEKIRQTAVYALGEIGKVDFYIITAMLEQTFNVPHHSVRNAVIGELKQSGEINPRPTLKFAKIHLHHPDPQIRREIPHGIELRGRTHTSRRNPYSSIKFAKR